VVPGQYVLPRQYPAASHVVLVQEHCTEDTLEPANIVCFFFFITSTSTDTFGSWVLVRLVPVWFNLHQLQMTDAQIRFNIIIQHVEDSDTCLTVPACAM
jgi:hypothetical protein